MVALAVIQEPAEIARYLAHAGLTAPGSGFWPAGPRHAPLRAAPHW